MANWRPVDVRLWNDRKFLACGDGARLLWLFLLTCPSLPIPGVVLGGDAALAELLGWTTERLRERFAELSRNGLRVRREGRIVWLQNALKYQPPANPNMVKGWGKKWDDVPEGDLKVELWEALRIACKSWSALFSKMFTRPFADGSCNGSVNRSSNGSTHEHQHDHENEHQHDLYADSPDAEPAKPPATPLALLPEPPVKPPRKKAKHDLPETWQPTARQREVAQQSALDLDDQVRRFRNHHAARGTQFVSWDRAFDTWLDNAPRFAEGTRSGPRGSAERAPDPPRKIPTLA